MEIFPSPEDRSTGEVFTTSWMEDDGISTVETVEKHMAKFTISYSATAKEVRVSVKAETTTFEPPWCKGGLAIILPVGDNRPVVSSNGATVEQRPQDECGRKRYQILI